jgi:hypothetical protein
MSSPSLSGTKADHFGQDGGAARLGVFQAFQHHGTAAAGDHEAVAVRVVGARGFFGCVVALARHGAHGVKQQAPCPRTAFFAATGEHHVLHAPLDLLGGNANAMRRGGTPR